MKRPPTDVRLAQVEFLQIADELAALSRRLRAAAESITPESLLAAELRGVAQCVRTDLLSDAIETLRVLGHQTEHEVVRRQTRLDATSQLLAAAS